MFGKTKKTVSMSIDDYIMYRDKLLEWNWMTEAFDSSVNKSIYKPTQMGVVAYSAIVKLIGKESLVNGYKLDIGAVEGLIEYTEVKPEAIEALIQGKMITKSYEPSTNIEKYELTPIGARVFIAFFVSNQRQVGTLPGDKKAAFFTFMNKLPERVIKASEIIEKLGKSFQAFDKQYNNNAPNQNNFDMFTPNYGIPKGPKYTKSKEYKQGKKRKKTKQKATKSKSQSYQKSRDPWSNLGDKMMKDMKF